MARLNFAVCKVLMWTLFVTYRPVYYSFL